MKAEILTHYKGHEEWICRLDDLMNQSIKTHRCIMTPFLTSSQIAASKRFLGSMIEYEVDGGYPQAERARIVLNPSEAYGEKACVCLTASFNGKFVKLEHRDVLGALMSLQLDRNQFGDHWIEEDRIVLYCTAEIKDYLIMNLTQIHHLNVRFEESPVCYRKKQSYEYFTRIVSNLRLDCIVACLAHCSRSKAQEKIKQQLVFVNDEILEDSSHLCNNGDTISIRRVGRFDLVKKVSSTKKEKFVVEFAKYC